MNSIPITQIDTISLKIPHHLVKKLDDIATKEDRSRSSLIRNLIASYIEDYEDITDALKASNK
jgi:metal-responsive CopG/Arc/MetJ family transcriptional regulator